MNLENNPVKTKNLNNLTSEQFSKLVQGIKDKKFRVVSWQGTVLMDLLEYAKDLVNRGHTSHNAQVVQLQEIVSQEKPQRTEVKEAAPSNQSQGKSPNNNIYLLIGGLVLFGLAILAFGYWLGKKKASQNSPAN